VSTNPDPVQNPGLQALTAASGDRPNAGRPAGRSARTGERLAISIRGLAKSYRHPWTQKLTRGLAPLDLDVHRGEVFGYLGPNGAGKTTTLKILTGLLKPSAGTATILDEPIERVSSRRRIGFLPEQPYFYDSLTGIEYLEFVAQLSGLTGRDAARAARAWLSKVGLGERERQALRKYSKGMLQRLGLAAAMVHEPDLLILDEPMSGLDPFGRRDVRDLILEQRERGTTVLFSSHILPDVEALCDRVAILLEGRLERVATVGELMDGSAPAVEVRVSGSPVFEIPARFAGTVERVDTGGSTCLKVTEPDRVQDLLAWLVSERVTVDSVVPVRPSLEQLFMAAAEQSAFHAQRVRRAA
jgi:ABC-2 type transport system ATP-binding protein